MAGRKKQIHPSLMPNEAEAFENFPQHGQPYDDPEDEELEDDFEDEEDEEEAAAQPADDRLDRMNQRLGELQAENEYLRRSIPPVTEPQTRAQPEEEEPDWEDLIFKDPKEAFRLHAEKVKKEVTQELEGKYQRETNTRDFWARFYRANDDLYEDQDLVTSTLNKHFAELSNMPSERAMEKLADLTRARIMKLSGKDPGDAPRVGKKRSRAYAEGANAPKPAARDTNVVPMSGSLSSTLRARRAKRFKRGQVA